MKITGIESVTNNKYKVYLDEQFAFVLYKGELSRYQVIVGKDLDEDLYHQIYKESVVKRAKLRAMHLLNAMGRTESQLRQKLAQGLYPEKAIEEAIAYVKSFGYINDVEYARSYISSRKEKKSRKELYMLLVGKGIDSEVLDTVFEEEYDNDDSAIQAIKSIMIKRRYHPDDATDKDTQKMLGYLMRKGFKYEDIRKVIQVSEWNA